MRSLHKHCLTILVVTFMTSEALSQQLKIGDSVPDICFSDIINYSKGSLQLSDLKAKLIILDFWSTKCLSCIEAFPYLDSLQNKFADNIQIIAVNRESRDWVTGFLSKHKKIKLPSSFPFIFGDTVLSQYFPHRFSGSHVWLDSNLIVRQRTYPWNLTERNILKYLSGKQLKLLQEKYVQNAIISEPIVKELAAGTDYYSIITHAVPGVTINNGVEWTPDGRVYHRWMGNTPAIQLFISAFSEDGKYNIRPRSTWILKGIDTTHFFYPVADSLLDYYMENYCYNYELKIPARKVGHLFEFMQQDLTRYFGITGKIKKRRIRTLVLVRTASGKEIKSKMDAAANKFNRNMLDSVFIVRDSTMKGFVEDYLKSVLIGNKIHLPLIDQTGYIGPVAMIIPNKIFNPYLDLNKFRNILKQYGLDLITKQRRTDVLILKGQKEGALF